MTKSSKDQPGGHPLRSLYDQDGVAYDSASQRRFAKRFARREARREHRRVVDAAVRLFYEEQEYDAEMFGIVFNDYDRILSCQIWDEYCEERGKDAVYERMMDEWYEEYYASVESELLATCRCTACASSREFFCESLADR